MRTLKYNLPAYDELGEEVKGADVIMDYSEANLEIARREAWNGEVEVVDDGQPEIPEAPSVQERIAALEAAVLAVMGVQNG